DSTAPSTPVTDPQCGQPTDQRTDNWVCPLSADSSPTGPGSAQLDNTAPSEGGGAGGYCDYTDSCFVQTNQLVAYWTGTVAYGTRRTGLIGYATADITWKLSGAQSWSSTVKW